MDPTAHLKLFDNYLPILDRVCFLVHNWWFLPSYNGIEQIYLGLILFNNVGKRVFVEEPDRDKNKCNFRWKKLINDECSSRDPLPDLIGRKKISISHFFSFAESFQFFQPLNNFCHRRLYIWYAAVLVFTSLSCDKKLFCHNDCVTIC